MALRTAREEQRGEGKISVRPSERREKDYIVSAFRGKRASNSTCCLMLSSAAWRSSRRRPEVVCITLWC